MSSILCYTAVIICRHPGNYAVIIRDLIPFQRTFMMRKIISAIIFILVIFSFFYQYKYGISTVPYEPKPTAAVVVKEDGSAVTPKSDAPDTKNAQAKVDPDMFLIKSHDIVLGNRDAKVVIVEYSALTCPHCAYFHREVFPALRKKYIDTGKIAYVVREFVSNKQDLDGAILARCLDDKKDPVKLLNILYGKQDSWAFNKNYRQILENIGQLAGISNEKYSECLADSDLVTALADQSRAITFYKEFVGTPAFFINGKMHRAAYDEKTLSQVIEVALMIENKKAEERAPMKANDEKKVE